jgi:hypothetical protein
VQVFLVKCKEHKEHGFYLTHPQHERESLDCPLCTLDKKADL